MGGGLIRILTVKPINSYKFQLSALSQIEKIGVHYSHTDLEYKRQAIHRTIFETYSCELRCCQRLVTQHYILCYGGTSEHGASTQKVCRL